MTSLRCANAPSAARSFLHLAHRTYFSTAVTQKPIAPLEFLNPRCAIRTTTSNTLPIPFSNITIRNVPIRSFSVSTARQATVCVQNSQKDEDGKEMVLEITPRAAQRLSQIMVKDNNPNLALRISVESGGCHGFQYLMSLITIPAKDAAEWSTVVNEDDTIFQFKPDDVETLPENGARIILDEPSLDLLKGSKVDFTQELIGSQFKIVDNPYATSSCGCGTSFDIKM